MQTKKKSKKPRIFISVEDGLIQSIITDRSVDIMILDCDVEGSDRYETYTEYSNGTLFNAIEGQTEIEISPEIVDHFFKQRKKK